VIQRRKGGRAPRISHEVEELRDSVPTSSITSVGSRASGRWSESDPMRPSIEGMDAAELRNIASRYTYTRRAQVITKR